MHAEVPEVHIEAALVSRSSCSASASAAKACETKESLALPHPSPRQPHFPLHGTPSQPRASSPPPAQRSPSPRRPLLRRTTVPNFRQEAPNRASLKYWRRHGRVHCAANPGKRASDARSGARTTLACSVSSRRWVGPSCKPCVSRSSSSSCLRARKRALKGQQLANYHARPDKILFIRCGSNLVRFPSGRPKTGL